MKKTLIMSAVAVALAASSAAALAAGNDTNAPVNGPVSGVYIQGGAGMGFLNMPNNYLKSQANTSYTHRNYNFATRIAGGYRYQVNANVGVGAELGYNYIGKTKTDASGPMNSANSTFRDMSVDLLGVVTYNFNPTWSVNAKAGAAYVMQTATLSQATPIVNITKKTHKVLPEIALGASYNLNQHVALGLEGTYMFGKKLKSSTTTGSAASANLSRIPSNGTVMATVTYTF